MIRKSHLFLHLQVCVENRIFFYRQRYFLRFLKYLRCYAFIVERWNEKAIEIYLYVNKIVVVGNILIISYWDLL